MNNDNRPRFLLNNCCFCCTVETGSKIIGYLGAIAAGLYIILAFTTLILLSIGQSETTAVSGVNTPTVSGTNNVNVAGNNNTSSVSGGALVAAIILTILTILIYFVILAVNIVLLIGLRQKRPNYVKIYLIASAVSLVFAFVVGIAQLIATFSAASILNLIYLHLPLYFLLVIRTAYYNMLEADVTKPNIIYAPAPNVAPPPAATNEDTNIA